MPFTFSHPAIVIPVKKKWGGFFSFTALVIGSMSPDFEYFITFKPLGTIGHTLQGFISFNLPLCFVIAYMFHNFIKKTFIMNMPAPIDRWYYSRAIEKWQIKSIKEFMIFSYSAMIGMISHIFWDAFTHKTGYFVNMFSLFREKVLIMNHQIPVYKFMQHGGTVIGFIIVMFYLYKARNINVSNVPRISIKNKIIYNFSIAAISLVIVLYRMFYTLDGFKIGYFGIYIVSFISSFFIAVILVSIILNLLGKN